MIKAVMTSITVRIR